MASLAGIYGLSMPKFSENMDPRDRSALNNYLYQLQEQLGYVLTNLDTSNFSPDMQQTTAQAAAASSRAASQTAQVRTLLGQMDAQFGAVAARLQQTAEAAATQPDVMTLRAAPAEGSAAGSEEAAMAGLLRDCFANLQKQVKETKANMEKAERAQPAQSGAAVAAAASREAAAAGRKK